ncbi:MAG: hypothetical protein LBT62_07610, partial [Deltaproteobacteria bacterium]|nr:hypothetical protein [Deltaproteobacteria bacterium]
LALFALISGCFPKPTVKLRSKSTFANLINAPAGIIKIPGAIQKTVPIKKPALRARKRATQGL